MSTHCGIAVKTEEGYKTIYCHHDGYSGYMWEMLTENYNSEELATKIVSFGDASSIDKKLEPAGSTHSFDNPEEDVCIFYHRDRNEDWSDVAPEYYTLRQLVKDFYHSYAWYDGCWHYYKGGLEIY